MLTPPTKAVLTKLVAGLLPISTMNFGNTARMENHLMSVPVLLICTQLIEKTLIEKTLRQKQN